MNSIGAFVREEIMERENQNWTYSSSTWIFEENGNPPGIGINCTVPSSIAENTRKLEDPATIYCQLVAKSTRKMVEDKCRKFKFLV